MNNVSILMLSIVIVITTIRAYLITIQDKFIQNAYNTLKENCPNLEEITRYNLAEDSYKSVARSLNIILIICIISFAFTLI